MVDHDYVITTPVLKVTSIEVADPACSLARVILNAPIPADAEGDARRGAGITIIVPLAEAQTFYVIGSEFDLSLSPHARERQAAADA